MAFIVYDVSLYSQQPNIDQFFDSFTATWARGNPNLATSSRYFSGEEQDKLDRQLTSDTLEYRRERIRLAREGLAELAKFDRSKLSEGQRLSADVLKWQLETIVAGGVSRAE